MRNLSDTIARLAALRASPQDHSVSSDRLSAMTGFGSNPGALAARIYVPEGLKPSSALVVVLHGCTQTAAAYDAGSGWSAIADDYGFALLYPEQDRANNPNRCFNWFNAGDITRGQGEVLSIRQMIDAMASRHGIDPRRVFVTGLSAGGGMANAMLATYPEVFAGGAIIGGLPFGTATTIPQAFDRMRGHGLPPSAELQARLAAASDHAGPWPRVSVWQGTADSTVVPANAQAIVDQWRGVHGIAGAPGVREDMGSYTRHVWTDASGTEAIESYTVPGLAHGTPIDASGGYGAPGPFMLDAGVSSSELIARSFGLTPSFERRNTASSRRRAAKDQPPGADGRDAESQGPVGNIQQVIDKALRAAGLMR